MVGLLVGLAIFAGAVGALLLSQATAGVGVMAGACLFAILARIAQAAKHHRELAMRTAEDKAALYGVVVKS